MKNNWLNSQNGSAIAMVMFALLIVGVTAGMIASWAEQLGREQKTMELSSTKALIDQSLNNAAFDEQVCHKIIQRDCGASPCPALILPPAPAAQIISEVPLSINIGAVGTLTSGLLSPEMGVQFVNVSLENLRSIGANSWEGTLSLEIAAPNNTKLYGGNRFPPLKISGFQVDVNAVTNQIDRCLASSPELNCKQLGGEIDSVNFNPPKCVLSTNYNGVACPAGQIPRKNLDGNVVCVAADTILEEGSCPQGKFLYSFGFGARACLTLSEAIGRKCGVNEIARSNGDGSGSCVSLSKIVGEVCPSNSILASDGRGGAKCVPMLSQDLNCVGSWGACNVASGLQTYTITTRQSGTGSQCPAVAGATRVCQCDARAMTWFVSGSFCQATFPATDRNTDSPLTPSTRSRTSGSASFRCGDNGQWVMPNPIPGATCSPAAGPQCPSVLKTWWRGSEECSANFESIPENSISPITANTAPNQTGAAAFRCLSGGTWSSFPSPGYTCGGGSAPPPSCPAATRTWTQGAHTCSADFASIAANTNSPDTPNTTPGKSGSAIFNCNASGNWEFNPTSGATCSAAASTEIDCPKVSGGGGPRWRLYSSVAYPPPTATNNVTGPAWLGASWLDFINDTGVASVRNRRCQTTGNYCFIQVNPPMATPVPYYMVCE